VNLILADALSATPFPHGFLRLAFFFSLVVESQERKKWPGGKSRSTCKAGCYSASPKIELLEGEAEAEDGQAKGGALCKSREHSDGDASLLDEKSATGRKESNTMLENKEEYAGKGQRGADVTEGRALKDSGGIEEDYLEAGSRILEGGGGVEDAEGEECIICQEEYQEGEEVTVLPCKHEFHVTCVVPWLEKHHTCPTCRHELDQEGPPQHEVRHACSRAPQISLGYCIAITCRCVRPPCERERLCVCV